MSDRKMRDATLAELSDLLGDRLLTPAESCLDYVGDASPASGGRPLAVVEARTVEDVSAMLKWASAHHVPVSVRGAGTGLAGGACAYDGGLVISLAGMTAIREIDPADRIAVVEAGAITADIDRAAAEVGLMYAPDPASYATSTIGGNIATNAGGLRCVRYGVTRDSVAGLEVVLADGSVITTGGRTRKNTAGYDLTGVFVGSEGTLGVVTAAILRLVPRPVDEPLTFRASFPSMDALGGAVSGIMGSPVTPLVLEFMDAATIDMVENYRPAGLDRSSAGVLLGQLTGVDAEEQFGVVETAMVAAGARKVERASGERGEELLAARRLVTAAATARGPEYVCDVAVPPSRLAEMLEQVAAVAERNGVPISVAGHAGDGNLHPSIALPDTSAETLDGAERISDEIAVAAIALGGTVTGEHGIGSLKLGLLARQFDEPTMAAHRRLKAAFDPLGILTPGRAV